MTAPPTEHSSKAEVWFLKEIAFGHGEERRRHKIITQNFNGPCSFIAICNILILREKIEILPKTRDSISYELLSQLVANYLLSSCGDKDISAALSAMPCTQTGMDLNPLFTGAQSFRPVGDGKELKLFELVGVELVHGWLVDPQSSEFEVLSKAEDYDTAAMLLVEADHATNGQLLQQDDEPTCIAGPSAELSQEQSLRVQDAIVVRRFLDATWMQLTYHGLFTLASIITPGSLVALFRSSHLSVLYRPPSRPDHIFSLVTDHSFLHEPSVVWERLDDVAYGDPKYVDANFESSVPLGGDFAGQSVEDTLRGIIDPIDEALAFQLQQEEDRLTSEHIIRQQQEQDTRRQQESQEQQPLAPPRNKPSLKKKKSDCRIM